jgi:HprK-related kinase B
VAATVKELAASLLRAHPTVSAIHLKAGECHIRVETNSAELARRLAEYFGPWLSADARVDILVSALESDSPPLSLPFVDWERERSKTRKTSLAELPDGRAIRKVRTGMQYLIGHGYKVVFGEAIRNYHQVANFVISQLINWLIGRQMVLCHAAAVGRPGRGISIAGFAGAGKSTLALRLVARGLAFTSNDRVLIGRREGVHVMSGLPKQPRINPGTVLSIPELHSVIPPERRRAFARLSEDELFPLEEKYHADVAAIFGESRWVLDAPLAAFLVLRWRRSERAATRFARVDLRERRDVLAAIIIPPGPFFEPAGGRPPGAHCQTEDEYLSALEGLPVYEVSGRLDFDRATAFCLNELLP